MSGKAPNPADLVTLTPWSTQDDFLRVSSALASQKLNQWKWAQGRMEAWRTRCDRLPLGM